MADFPFFKMSAVRHLGFLKVKNFILPLQFGGPLCVIVSNFAKIGILLYITGRPNFVFVICPKNDDFLFFGFLFLRPKNLRKTTVNARTGVRMRCWNLSTLPKLVASDVTSNKQRVCACGLYQTSAGGLSMTITRRRLKITQLELCSKWTSCKTSRAARGTFELSAHRPPRPQPVSGQFVSKWCCIQRDCALLML